MIQFRDFDLRAINRKKRSFVLVNQAHCDLVKELENVLGQEDDSIIQIDLSSVDKETLIHNLNQVKKGAIIFTNIETLSPLGDLFQIVRVCMKADFWRIDCEYSEPWMNHLKESSVNIFVVVEKDALNQAISTMVRTTGCSFFNIGENGIIREYC